MYYTNQLPYQYPLQVYHDVYLSEQILSIKSMQPNSCKINYLVVAMLLGLIDMLGYLPLEYSI